MHGAVWLYFVGLQRRYNQIRETMGLYLMCLFVFTSVLVYGAFTAGEVRLYPEHGVPSFLRVGMAMMIVFGGADATNLSLYLIQNHSYSTTRCMLWVLVMKCFAVVYFTLAFDNQWP